jgi:hypothetical protein
MKKTLIALLLLSLFLSNSLYAAESFPPNESPTETAVVTETTDETKDVSEKETQIDESTKMIKNKYFDLTLERKPQSAFGKHIPYILTITPHLNSNRTQILWNVPTTLNVNPKHKEFVSLEDGKTYTFQANIKPLRGGIFDFSVSVISWQHDTNYTNSIHDTITLNNSLVLQPVSSQYTIMNIVKVLAILVLFVIACIITVVLVKRYMVKAKKWLTPPS